MTLSVSDHLGLRRLVDSYAVAVDRRDGEAVADLFLHGGELLVHSNGDPDGAPDQTRNTRDQLVAGPLKLSRFLSTSHLVGQQVVEPEDEGAARGIVYCIADHLYSNPDGQRMTFVVHVRYLDQYERMARSWFFRRRRVLFDFVEHRPVGGTNL